MKKITKAVIPVAGMGTRFLPAVKAIPKGMLPVIDKPVIQYIVEECVASGIEEILFITSPYNKAIEDHFDKSFELESRLEASGRLEFLKIVRDISSLVKCYYIRQGEPMGTGHAVSLAKSFVGDEYFVMAYGDDLYKPDGDDYAFKQLLDIHYETGGNVIGCKEVSKDLVNRYGIIKLADGNKIETIVEKPKIEDAPSNLAGLGRYLVSSKIFDKLDNLSVGASNEYQFTDAMKDLMEDEEFYVCNISNKYCDMGNKVEYVKTIIDFALEREDLKDAIKEYIVERASEK